MYQRSDPNIIVIKLIVVKYMYLSFFFIIYWYFKLFLYSYVNIQNHFNKNKKVHLPKIFIAYWQRAQQGPCPPMTKSPPNSLRWSVDALYCDWMSNGRQLFIVVCIVKYCDNWKRTTLLCIILVSLLYGRDYWFQIFF